MDKDKTYKIRFLIKGQDIVFTGKVVYDDDNKVIFIDKYGVPLEYNKEHFISAEEVKR